MEAGCAVNSSMSMSRLFNGDWVFIRRGAANLNAMSGNLTLVGMSLVTGFGSLNCHGLRILHQICNQKLEIPVRTLQRFLSRLTAQKRSPVMFKLSHTPCNTLRNTGWM